MVWVYHGVTTVPYKCALLLEELSEWVLYESDQFSNEFMDINCIHGMYRNHFK